MADTGSLKEATACCRSTRSRQRSLFGYMVYHSALIHIIIENERVLSFVLKMLKLELLM